MTWVRVSVLSLCIASAVHAAPKGRVYFLADSSTSPYYSCSRRFEKMPRVQLCLDGNGRYDQTLVEKELIPIEWISSSPKRDEVLAQFDEVVLVCKHKNLPPPSIARVTFPSRQEKWRGKKARIEIPCDWTPDRVVITVRDVSWLLESIVTQPQEALRHIDQYAETCTKEGTSSNSCKRLIEDASRVFKSKLDDGESIPLLSMSGVQITSGLSRTAPSLPQFVPTRALQVTSQEDLPADHIRRINNRLNARLAACGWTNQADSAESSLQAYGLTHSPTDLEAEKKRIQYLRDRGSVYLDRTLMKSPACAEQMATEERWLSSQGWVIRPEGMFLRGRKVDMMRELGDTEVLEQIYFRERKLQIKSNDPSQSEQVPPPVPTRGEILNTLRSLNLVDTPQTRVNFLGKFAEVILLCEDNTCIQKLGLVSSLFNYTIPQSPDGCFVLRDVVSADPGTGATLKPIFQFPCSAACPGCPLPPALPNNPMTREIGGALETAPSAPAQ